MKILHFKKLKGEEKNLLAAQRPFIRQMSAVRVKRHLYLWEIKVELSFVGHTDIHSHAHLCGLKPIFKSLKINSNKSFAGGT